MHFGTGLLLLSLLIASISPLAADDGDYDTTFTLNDVVSWNDGGDVTLADVAAGDTGAFAVGSIVLPGEVEALHWKGYNRGGGPLDQGCSQASETIFTLATGGSGALAALIDSSGNLVVGGWGAFFGTESTRRALVARFDLTAPGCDLDSGFSANGWEIFDDESWCDTEECDVVDLVEIRPETGAVLSARIVALVRSELSPLSSRFFLLGLTSAGAIDTSFGTNGWRELTQPDLGILYPEAHLAVDGTGGLHVLVTRYDPNGSLDLDVFALSLFPDGDFVTPANPLFLIADPGDGDADDPVGKDLEFAPDGTWLVSYLATSGSTKVRVQNFEQGLATTYDETTAPHELAAQGDGKLVAAFDFAASDGLATDRRLLDIAAFCPKDPAHGGGDGRRPYDVDLGGSNSDTVAELVLWNGKPLLAGTAADDSGTSGFLLRAENSYVFADSFEQATAAYWSGASGLVFPE